MLHDDSAVVIDDRGRADDFQILVLQNDLVVVFAFAEVEARVGQVGVLAGRNIEIHNDILNHMTDDVIMNSPIEQAEVVLFTDPQVHAGG